MGPCDPEFVSALVDGEVDDHDTEAALRHLTACRDCQELFERYNAVRSMIRGEMSTPAPAGLADRISAATGADVTVSVEFVESASATARARSTSDAGRIDPSQHAQPVEPGDRSNVISAPQSGHDGGVSPSTSRSNSRSLQS
mgnify:CR=1 FL=1